MINKKQILKLNCSAMQCTYDISRRTWRGPRRHDSINFVIFRKVDQKLRGSCKQMRKACHKLRLAGGVFNQLEIKSRHLFKENK